MIKIGNPVMEFSQFFLRIKMMVMKEHVSLVFFHCFPLHQLLFSFPLHCIWSFLPVVAEVFKPKNVQQSNGLKSVFRLLRSWVVNG